MANVNPEIRSGRLAIALLMTLAAMTAARAADKAGGPRGVSPASGPLAPRADARQADPMAEYQRLGKPNLSTAGLEQEPAEAIPARAQAKAGRSYLRCVFRLSRDGRYDLIRAVEIEGDPAIPEEAAGPILAEVSKDGQVVSVQANPDPFEKRGFPAPDGKGPQGHYFQAADEAEVSVEIPGAALADADLDKLSVRFYQWEGRDALHRIDRESLAEHKRVHRVRGMAEVPGPFLGSEIRSKGKRAPR